jgi:alpha-glucosidase
LFGGPAWKFDPATKQWYYHYFYTAQPDLNWRNPEVEDAMFDVARWWYRRGVAGFRLDAVTNLFEDPELTDNPLVDHEINAYGDPVEKEVHNLELPELHGVLQGLRQVSDEFDGVLVGETWTDTLDQLKLYYGPHHNELQLPIDFRFFAVGKLSAPEFRQQIAAAESFPGQPVYVFSNHDEPRQYTKYGDGKHNDQIAKLLASLYLTLRGTPIMYYGEEIGMQNNDPKRKEDVQDPIGRLGWPKEKGRDGERTPMQWNGEANAGFSQMKPWNPVDALYQQYNVEAERKDRNSILNYYRNLLRLRHSNPALLEGNYVALNQDDANVLAYLRTYRRKRVLIVLNMSATEQAIKLDVQSKGISAKSTRVLLASFETPPRGNVDKIDLQPFGAYIAELE